MSPERESSINGGESFWFYVRAGLALGTTALVVAGVRIMNMRSPVGHRNLHSSNNWREIDVASLDPLAQSSDDVAVSCDIADEPAAQIDFLYRLC